MKTILIIDPESVGSGLTGMLNRQGMKPFVVSEAQTALTIVRSGMPVDLIIMELVLPDMEGIDLLSALRRDRPDLPVLIVTSRGTVESYLQAVNLGVVEYLNKPVLSRELACIIRSALTGPRSSEMLLDAAGPARDLSADSAGRDG